MPHTININSFLTAANGGDYLLRCYCGLIALELVIKQEVGLADHDVIHGLNKLGKERFKTRAWADIALLNFANKLQTDLVAIQVNGKDGLPRTVPKASYPYIRYCRFSGDGWPEPNTKDADLRKLANTIQQIRAFLKTNLPVNI